MSEIKKFYVTEEINLPLQKDIPFNNDFYKIHKRHNIRFIDDKKFYQNALAQVPNSELVILKDQYAIGNVMKAHYNTSLNFQNLKKKYNAKLANLVDSEEEYNQKKKSEDFTFMSDIAGIILPMAHADWNDLGSIVKIMNAPEIIQNTKSRYASVKLQTEKNKEEMPYLAQTIIEGEEFFKFTGVPVFEAWKFLPKYRYKNNQIGEYSYETYFPVFEVGFNNWLKTNFETQKNEVQK